MEAKATVMSDEDIEQYYGAVRNQHMPQEKKRLAKAERVGYMKP